MIRCSGHCCRAFTLPYSPEQLLQPDRLLEDGDVIRGMLVFLKEANEGDPHPTDPVQTTAGRKWYYTCKHLDDQSGNCMIYATRPMMCRDYPYGNECKFSGCTMEPKTGGRSDKDRYRDGDHPHLINRVILLDPLVDAIARALDEGAAPEPQDGRT